MFAIKRLDMSLNGVWSVEGHYAEHGDTFPLTLQSEDHGLVCLA